MKYRALAVSLVLLSVIYLIEFYMLEEFEVKQHERTFIEQSRAKVVDDIGLVSMLSPILTDKSWQFEKRHFAIKNTIDCNQPFVRTRPSPGRFGNKFVHYASLIILRNLYDIQVGIDQRSHDVLLTYFQHLSLPLLPLQCLEAPVKMDYSLNLTVSIFEEFRIKKAHPIPLNQSLELRQPEHLGLILSQRNMIREELRFRNEFTDDARIRIQGAIKQYLERFQAAGEKIDALTDITVVGIHIRRTDYLAHICLTTGDFSTKLPPILYYQRAMQYFRDRYDHVVFIVISDDMQWCRTYLFGIDVFIEQETAKRDPGYDVALLSICDHTITSHGTFSFMGSVLGTGLIVFPILYSIMPTRLTTELLMSNSSYLVSISQQRILR